MTRFKLFDTAQGQMDLESNINDWLSSHPKVNIISANLTWDQSNIVYTILYTEPGTRTAGRKQNPKPPEKP